MGVFVGVFVGVKYSNYLPQKILKWEKSGKPYFRGLILDKQKTLETQMFQGFTGGPYKT